MSANMAKHELDCLLMAEPRASELSYIRPEGKDLIHKRKLAGSCSSVSDFGNDEMRAEIRRLQQKKWEGLATAAATASCR